MSNGYTRERPFEYLRRKSSSELFSEETVRHWYAARAYILDRLKDISFCPEEDRHLDVIVDGDSPLMLSVLRQIALSAHYINYVEYDSLGEFSCRNRTHVSLVSQRDDILEELEKEEYLGNLLHYCKYTVGDQVHNADSFIDIEFRIVGQAVSISEEEIRITESDVQNWVNAQKEEDVFTVDGRQAVLAARIYALGAIIDNLPSEDIHNAKRYRMALDTFQYRLQERMAPLVNDRKWREDPIGVMNDFSNLLCADCFASRALAVRHYAEKERIPEPDAWEKCNEALSQSEHNRWVVEKLILGYRPLNVGELLRFESLFGNSKKVYADGLKGDAISPAHLDICSNRDLRRINPDDMKYDSFLMLAIPYILERVRTDSV